MFVVIQIAFRISCRGYFKQPKKKTDLAWESDKIPTWFVKYIFNFVVKLHFHTSNHPRLLTPGFQLFCLSLGPPKSGTF